MDFRFMDGTPKLGEKLRGSQSEYTFVSIAIGSEIGEYDFVYGVCKESCRQSLFTV
jgi:hypothetical protein